ncbi:unnamed protein product [Schistocephalus solidus]|uniref:Uncharacterized protein n=1 Tax=Schistocephalus solidus TaxID=70667 RepID=A0A183SS66_SCHSO|nr:unnamed protein product [Schistocephalus solidus]
MRLLLRKLGTKEHKLYTDIPLPKNPRDLTFDETVKQLSGIFGEKSSLFNIRYQCLKLVKTDTDDFLTLASIFNRECENVKLRTMVEDQFKYLNFGCTLLSPRNAEIRTHLLSKIEQDPDTTLQTLTAECQRLKNLQHDSAIVEQPSSSLAATSGHAITHTKSMSLHKSQDSTPRKPSTACWHFVRFCPFKKHVPQKAHKRGNKRLVTMLLGYDFDIRHHSNTNMGQVDALSRLINSRTKEPEEIIIVSVAVESMVHSLFMDSMHGLPVTFEDVRNATRQDQLLRQVTKYHRTQWPAKLSQATVNDYILFYECVVVPQTLQP